jgi:hypothetical protein
MSAIFSRHGQKSSPELVNKLRHGFSYLNNIVHPSYNHKWWFLNQKIAPLQVLQNAM